jgi:steroid 5-alpha reductase family enzyme
MSFLGSSNHAGAGGYNTSASPLQSSPAPSGITYHASLQWELLDVGILRDTILPSVQLHVPLAIVAYGIGRATNSVEAKDWLWPVAPMVNGWWSAVGRKVYSRGLTVGQAFSTLSRPERLLLTGVTLWGGRLFYRIASRSIKRRRSGKGSDDPRYEAEKREDGYWNKALFTLFLPEALIQTVTSTPFTAPFHHQGAVLTGHHPLIQALAVGLFSAGFTLEVLADAQLEKFKNTGRDQSSVCKEGVWSLVRHPK